MPFGFLPNVGLSGSQERGHPASFCGGDPTTLLIKVLFPHQARYYRSHAEYIFPLLDTLRSLNYCLLTFAVLGGRHLQTHRLVHLKEDMEGELAGPLESGQHPT